MKNRRLFVVSALGITVLLSACGASSPTSVSQATSTPQSSAPSSQSSSMPSSESLPSSSQESTAPSTPTPSSEPSSSASSSSSSEGPQPFSPDKFVEALDKIPTINELVYGDSSPAPKMKMVETTPSTEPEAYLEHNALQSHVLFQLRPYENAVQNAKQVVDAFRGVAIKEGVWRSYGDYLIHLKTSKDVLSFQKLNEVHYTKIRVEFDEEGKSTIDYLEVFKKIPAFGTAATFYTSVHFVQDDYVSFDYSLSAFLEAESSDPETYPAREERHNYHLYSDLKKGTNVSFVVGTSQYRLSDGSLLWNYGHEVYHVEKVGDYFIQIRTAPPTETVIDEQTTIKTEARNFMDVYNADSRLVFDWWFVDTKREEGEVAMHLKLNIYEALSNWSALRYDDEIMRDDNAEVKVGEEWKYSGLKYTIQVDNDHYFGHQTPLFVCDARYLDDALAACGLEYALEKKPDELYQSAREQFAESTMFGLTYEEYTNMSAAKYKELFPSEGYTYEEIVDALDLPKDEKEKEPTPEPDESEPGEHENFL